mgnify:CR=1 FL=1
MDAARTLYQIEASLRSALSDPGPCPDAHSRVAPRPRVGWKAGVIPEGSRTAAALLLLYPIDDRAHLCLTRRAGSLGTHAGQISLPGGAVDEGETIEQAALREAREEVGLDSKNLQVLGRLTPLYIPVSNFALYPVLGVLAERPSLVASADEVAHILEVAIDDLLSPSSLRPGWLWRGADTITVPFFALCGERVWGATAMVLSELVHLLSHDESTPRTTAPGVSEPGWNPRP